jgi:WhiB family redox-sensing transcriptional regulator
MPRRRPAPTTEQLDWQLQAKCRKNPDAPDFFPVGDANIRPEQAQRKVARGFCPDCPVIDKCLEYALSHQEMYGVWGGRTEAEREAILKGRPRPIIRRIHTTTRQFWMDSV